MTNRRPSRFTPTLIFLAVLCLHSVAQLSVPGVLADDRRPFLPVNPQNVWVYASFATGGGVTQLDTIVVRLEVQSIVGEQYWSLKWLSGPFRVGGDGNLWFRMNESMRSSVRQFKQALADNPELSTSNYYQRASFLNEISPDQQDLLLYDFSAPVIDNSSLGAGLDYTVLREYIDVMERSVPVMAWKVDEPSVLQCRFQLECCGTEWSGSVVFERGIGIVRVDSGAVLSNWRTHSQLIWAWVDGVEYGTHPGEKYIDQSTAIHSTSWGYTKWGARKKSGTGETEQNGW